MILLAYGIAVDGSGNVYVTGYSNDTWNGPGGQSPLNAYNGGGSGYDIFVLKLDSSGAYQWHTFYGSGNDGGDRHKGRQQRQCVCYGIQYRHMEWSRAAKAL